MDAELERALGSPRARPKPPRIKRQSKRHLEASVLRGCLKLLLNDPRVLYRERRTAGLFEVEGRTVASGTPGAADIWFVWQNRQHCEVECKRRDGKGRLSEKQKKFRDFCKATGIPWVAVKSEKELMDWLDKLPT